MLVQDKTELGSRVTPFLTRFAAVRTEAGDIPGHYSDDNDMWLVETPTGYAPIIEAASALVELVTKTKVERESDDQSPHPLLELTTKTDTNRESDDQHILAAAALELTTKTAAQLESDDTSPRHSGMW